MIENIYRKLSEAVPDPAVGISLAHLLGDEHFSYYVTRIPPGNKLAAHFHRNGDELYQVIEGRGEIWISDADHPNQGIEQYSVNVGDTFMIQALKVHQLCNTGTEPLVMMFGCAKSHITTDRSVVENICHERGES